MIHIIPGNNYKFYHILNLKKKKKKNPISVCVRVLTHIRETYVMH